MAEFPALPLWTDAYLGDTTHLSTIEHGAYLLLLMAMWRAKGTSLPNDDKLLARYARLTAGQWERIKPVVMAFFDIGDGRITQGRLTDEAVAVRQYSKRQSDNAKTRWLKNKGSAHAMAMPDVSQTHAPLPLTPSQAVEPKSGSTAARKRAPRKTCIPGDALLTEKQRSAARDRSLSDAEAEAQFSRFRDTALANGRAYADWDKAWINWLTSRWFQPILSAGNVTPIKGHGYAERFDDAFNDLTARLAVQPFPTGT